jgi:hypothetical protein
LSTSTAHWGHSRRGRRGGCGGRWWRRQGCTRRRPRRDSSGRGSGHGGALTHLRLGHGAFDAGIHAHGRVALRRREVCVALCGLSGRLCDAIPRQALPSSPTPRDGCEGPASSTSGSRALGPGHRTTMKSALDGLGEVSGGVDVVCDYRDGCGGRGGSPQRIKMRTKHSNRASESGAGRHRHCCGSGGARRGLWSEAYIAARQREIVVVVDTMEFAEPPLSSPSSDFLPRDRHGHSPPTTATVLFSSREGG